LQTMIVASQTGTKTYLHLARTAHFHEALME
jgi:hypothetical protein